MKKYDCVKQEDKYDCGIAALATILMYYNKIYSLKELKQIISYNSNHRTNLFQLYFIATKLGFKSEAVILQSFEDFDNIELPCIVQLKFSNDILHFVVVYRIEKNFIIIADPAIGLITIPVEMFNKFFTGIILMIY